LSDLDFTRAAEEAKAAKVKKAKSLFENWEWCCFRGNSCMARRDEGDCIARQRKVPFGESNLQGLGSPYPLWVFD
jgi:hypothetical protein